jgi:signal transduction histidine kinase
VVTSQKGDSINVLCYTAPIRNPAGEIVSVIEMSTDITELRQLQTQLSSIGLIVSSTAHDIKGVLGGLKGGNYLVETGIKKGDLGRIKQGWEMVQRNLHRVRNMVFNLLYYSKDRGIKWESVDIYHIAHEVFDILKDRAKEMKVNLEIDVEKDIGIFDGEMNAIHSMLMNLVENSIYACWVDKKKENHLINFSVYQEGDNVIFKISDNGMGMDRETRDKAFSLFFSSKGSEGTGLGLFVANKIVKSHHGGISIESSPGEGSCFTVKIPKKSSN